jgi:hypothetical protein
MNKTIIPKGFFQDNPIEQFSAANICYFKITLASKVEAQ